MQMRSLVLALAAAALTPARAQVALPTVTLGNAADAGVTLPAVGLGTGGYSGDNSTAYGAYPECWSATTGCGANVAKAVGLWLAAGGRRIDSANSYQNQAVVGAALVASGVPRADLFILSKVGPSNPLGYNDSLAQFATIQAELQTPYVDLLLVHWPWQSVSQVRGTYTPGAVGVGGRVRDAREGRRVRLT
jgi:diketogulonate reductase-like aldo/keto reductase